VKVVESELNFIVSHEERAIGTHRNARTEVAEENRPPKGIGYEGKD
jgi:hypothetical protein